MSELNSPLVGELPLKVVCEELRRIFDDDHVNIEQVEHLLNACSYDPSEWEKYAHFDEYRYTRNLIDSYEGKYDLILLCWGEGHATGIHDHNGSNCFLKVMAGEIRETLYSWPDDFDKNTLQMKHQPKRTLKLNKTITLSPGEVTLIHDRIGLHRVENPNHTKRAVTMHLYCPPITQCINFEESSGRANQCRITFYSKDGEKNKPTAASTEVSPFTETN